MHFFFFFFTKDRKSPSSKQKWIEDNKHINVLPNEINEKWHEKVLSHQEIYGDISKNDTQEKGISEFNDLVLLF